MRIPFSSAGHLKNDHQGGERTKAIEKGTCVFWTQCFSVEDLSVKASLFLLEFFKRTEAKIIFNVVMVNCASFER